MVQPQRSLAGAVEEIAGIQRAVAEVFEEAAVELVAAGLADHADLARRSSAVLGRVVARIDPELGDRLEAVLQAEAGGDLAVEVAGRSIDDRAGFHPVETDCIFLVGAAAEANVVEAPAACRLRARGEQVQLRKLAAVQRKLRHFARVDVGPDRGGAEIDGRQLPAGDVDFGRHGLGLQDDVENALLADAERQPGVPGRAQALRLRFHGVGGRRQVGEREETSAIRDGLPFLRSFLVGDDYGGAGDDRARAVGHRADDSADVTLSDQQGQSHDPEQCKSHKIF